MSETNNQDRDLQTARLMVHLFKVMAEEEDIPRGTLGTVPPEQFLDWAAGRMPLLNREETCEAAGCTEVGWEFLDRLAHDPAGAVAIHPVWYNVCLAHRGDPKHRVSRLTTFTLVHYDDGSVFPVKTSVPAELIDGGEITDGLFACHGVNHYKTVTSLAAERGLDALHDMFPGDYGGDAPLEVLLGVVHKVLPQIDEAVRPKVLDWLRLVQGAFLPSLPPELKARAAAIKAKKEAARRAKTNPLPEGVADVVGGFDE